MKSKKEMLLYKCLECEWTGHEEQLVACKAYTSKKVKNRCCPACNSDKLEIELYINLNPGNNNLEETQDGFY